MCNSARSHALADTQWNISPLTGSWIAYCGNDRSKLMDPHRNMSITSHCSQLWLLDEWLQVVYGIWWRPFLPITERERRQNVSCAAGIRMRWDKGLWGLEAMWETRHGSHVPEPDRRRSCEGTRDLLQNRLKPSVNFTNGDVWCIILSGLWQFKTEAGLLWQTPIKV